MKNQKVYILFSHLSQEAEYEIWSASSNVEAILNKCLELGLKDIYDDEHDQELDSELIHKSNYIDFGFIDDDRFVLKSFEVEVPANNELYAVFANGEEEYSWEADLEALCASQDKAIDFVVGKLSEFEDEELLEEYREQFAETDYITDSNFTYWNIVQIGLN